jgi:hypothetical protein
MHGLWAVAHSSRRGRAAGDESMHEKTREETGRNRPGLRERVHGQVTVSSGSVGAREAMMRRIWNTLAIIERMAKLEEAGR